jgi:RimJ/RimL family protein N-acetyltransferase
MTEAVSGIIQWALRNEPLQRIWAVCDIDNENSVRILQKVGMTEEGILRRWALHPNISDMPRDCRSFSLP